MAVPETTMNEDGSFVFWQENIGLSGHILAIQSETVSKAVKEGSHLQLWPRVFTSDTRHVPASTRLGD
jgi:hypothetical protein